MSLCICIPLLIIILPAGLAAGPLIHKSNSDSLVPVSNGLICK